MPEGTEIRAYSPVALEERTEKIGLREDLVLGGGPQSPPEERFSGVVSVAVDDDGRIYVVDQRNHRIQVFDADGVFLRSLGRFGTGSGELQYPTTAAVVGGVLVVDDRRNGRFSLWDLGGGHVADHPRPTRAYPSIIGANSRGEVVGVDYGSRRVDDTLFDAAIAFDLELRPLRTYFELPFDWAPSAVVDGMPRYAELVPRSRPSFALANDGTVYAVPADVYEVASKAADGRARWVVRVDTPRVPFEPGAERIRRFLADWSTRHPDVRESDINWPEYVPIIERLEVDGNGNLYVLPWIDRLPGARGDRPVDVYDASGKRIMAGIMPDLDWIAASGPYVYTSEVDPESGVERVVRYRLVTPF